MERGKQSPQKKKKNATKRVNGQGDLEMMTAAGGEKKATKFGVRNGAESLQEK